MIKNGFRNVVAGVILPILAGTVIYLIISPQAYVTKFFWQISGMANPFRNININEMPLLVRVIRYYLCDYLWALALTHMIFLILGGEKPGMSIIISMAFCMAYEVLQLTSFVPGVFDPWDLVVESIAGLTVIAEVLRKRRKEYEKSNRSFISSECIWRDGSGQRIE